MKYDLTVFGGGTAGVAAAYIASKRGLKTLLVEKTDSLGGSITQGLVLPSMKVDTQNINTEFFTDLLAFADKYKARHKYSDGNEAWFNPQLLKIVFDTMLASVNCTVLFNSTPNDIKYINNSNLFSCKINHKILSLYTETNYIVDATAEAYIFKLLNCELQPQSENSQAPTLRFIMSGVDIEKFADWVEVYDKDRNVTTVDRTGENIHLSTACTWDESRNWALAPIFSGAVSDGVLDKTDTAYFQIFTIPSMPASVSFNCPRVILDESEDLLDPFVYSRALMQARERIYRLQAFCKKYLPGFENSYISQIADMFGIRESYRIHGKYTFTKDDIINCKTFDKVAFACNYPIDIHSNKKSGDTLQFTKHTYHIPIEALISSDYDNLYAAGRIISTDFEAQAAIRTQMSCFSMGEAAANDIYNKISNLNKMQ